MMYGLLGFGNGSSAVILTQEPPAASAFRSIALVFP